MQTLAEIRRELYAEDAKDWDTAAKREAAYAEKWAGMAAAETAGENEPALTPWIRRLYVGWAMAGAVTAARYRQWAEEDARPPAAV